MSQRTSMCIEFKPPGVQKQEAPRHWEQQDTLSGDSHLLLLTQGHGTCVGNHCGELRVRLTLPGPGPGPTCPLVVSLAAPPQTGKGWPETLHAQGQRPGGKPPPWALSDTPLLPGPLGRLQLLRLQGARAMAEHCQAQSWVKPEMG